MSPFFIIHYVHLLIILYNIVPYLWLKVVKKHKHSLLSSFQHENIHTLSDNLVGASKLSQTSFEHLLSEEHLLKESIDDDEYDSSSKGSDNDDSDDDNEDEDQLLNQVGKLKLGKNVNIPNIHADGKNIMEERACPVTTSRRHHLYPPGKIMHIVPSRSSENSNLDYNDVNEKHVLYKTPTQLYGKLRFSRGMILDHSTKKYLRKLQQLINQLEEK